MSDLSAERQTRLVTEALQTQTPKQALQLCEKYLRKNQRSIPLLALKALLLVYSGRDLEGLELAKELKGLVSSDLISMGYLDKVFVALNDYKLSVEMFEHAFGLQPTEDIGALLFFSVMRSQDTKALFPMALRLHSLFKKDKYLFWAITALHLQAQTPAVASEPATNLMRLAEKMILKAFSPDRANQRSRDELLLLLTTLQASGNSQEALRLFESHCDSLVPNKNERLMLRAESLERCHSWDALISLLAAEFTAQGISDWTLWKLYTKAIDASGERNAHVPRLPELLSRAKQLTEPRMLHLAAIDAAVIFGASEAEILSRVEDYLGQYIDREVCLPDMQHIVKVLSEGVRAKLAQACRGRRGPNWPRLGRMLEPRCDGWPTLGRDRPMPDHQLYAATVHVDEYGRSQKIESLLLAVQSCTAFLHAEPDSYAAKLLLLLLFIHLGCPALAMDAFKSLDIKQLQIDTLSYVLSDHLIELGDPHSDVFFQEAYLIYDDNRTSSWSLLAEAFGRESYHNVLEFYEFSRRLEYSIQAVACICGSIRFELLHRDFGGIQTYLMNLKPEELLLDEGFVRNLADNRDRSVFDFCDHGGQVRALLLDKLPTFGLGSIVVYTFFPMAVRALLANELPQLAGLVRGFRQLSGAVAASDVPARDVGKLGFLASLFDGLEAYVGAEGDRDILTAHLPSLASAFIEPRSGPGSLDIPSSPYRALCALQAAVELDRWMSLAVVSFVRGACPSQRSRRLVLQELSGVSALLHRSQDCLSQQASDAMEQLRASVCPAGSPLLWEQLKQSWLASVEQLLAIVKGSSAMLNCID